jgi:hypothetical protein
MGLDGHRETTRKANGRHRFLYDSHPDDEHPEEVGYHYGQRLETVHQSNSVARNHIQYESSDHRN